MCNQRDPLASSFLTVKLGEDYFLFPSSMSLLMTTQQNPLAEVTAASKGDDKLGETSIKSENGIMPNQTVGKFICKHCSKKFKLTRDLRRHEELHSCPSYKCKECDYATTSLAHMTVHMRRHSDNTDLPFKCTECDKRFKKAIELQEHYDVHSVDKPFTCNACSSAFYLNRQLLAHCKRMHPEMKAETAASTTCDICGKVLANKRSLFRHKESHNPTKLYLCDYCGKSLSSTEHLKKHRRIHTGEKPYVCDICGKGFSVSENLRLHRRIHTGEKPYKCDQCPKAFSQKSTLTIHRRGHTGERPYICQICQRGFSCQGNLTAHQKTTCV